MTICLFKVIGVLLFITIVAQSCNTSTYYFRKRIKHHYTENCITADSASHCKIIKGSTKNVNSVVDTTCAIAENSSYTIIEIEKKQIINPAPANSVRIFSSATTLKEQSPFIHYKQSHVLFKNGTGVGILLAVLIIGILVLAGFAMYWVGVWAFGLALILFWRILVFIGAVTLVSVLMTFMLYLLFLVAYSIGHASYKKPYYPGDIE